MKAEMKVDANGTERCSILTVRFAITAFGSSENNGEIRNNENDY